MSGPFVRLNTRYTWRWWESAGLRSAASGRCRKAVTCEDPGVGADPRMLMRSPGGRKKRATDRSRPQGSPGRAACV